MNFAFKFHVSQISRLRFYLHDSSRIKISRYRATLQSLQDNARHGFQRELMQLRHDVVTVTLSDSDDDEDSDADDDSSESGSAATAVNAKRRTVGV